MTRMHETREQAAEKPHILRCTRPPRFNVRLCENSETSKKVEKGNIFTREFNDLIPKFV
jgi:hypothetical protein